MRFADGTTHAGNCLGPGSFGGRGHGWIPVQYAPATIAGEHFAFAELVPHLRPDAHAAAGALLVVDAGDAGAAGAGEAVVADEPLSTDERTEGFALGIQGGEFGGELLLAGCGAHTGLFEGAGEGFHLGSGSSESGFGSFSTLQAGEFLVFQAIGF